MFCLLWRVVRLNSMLLEEKAMSKDMLGSVTRAAVGVPQDYLDVLARIASKFSIKNPNARPEGEVWHAYLQKMLEQGLPDWAYLLGVTPTVFELGKFVVNYDETTEQKLRCEAARALINSEDFLSESRRLSKGVYRSAERKGLVHYKASAVGFNSYLKRQVVGEWGCQNKKIMASVKDGIDIIAATPTLKLAHALPLVMFDQCLYDHQEFSFAPSFREAGNRVDLGFERFDEGSTPTLWAGAWKFLALEEIQPGA